MSDDNPSIMSHVSVGVKDFEKAKAFYDVVLATVGASRVLDFPGGAAYGKAYPEFWVGPPHDNGVVETANGVHFAFNSPDKDGVHAFWEAAIAAGALPDGEPGPRPLYGLAYYGCFVRDLDGHKIEAIYWDVELAEQGG